MLISEIFYSIQGEGELTGVPSVFVRTAGCNLRCDWCDTPYASWEPEGRTMTADEVAAKVREYPAGHCVLTGGEPMVAKEIRELAQVLRQEGKHITIETAGTVKPDGIACDLASISPKLSNSTPKRGGEEWVRRHEETRLNFEVLREWVLNYPYQLKFVVSGEKDLEEIQDLLGKLGVDVPAARVLLMPESIDQKRLEKLGLELVEVCKRHGFRYCHRLHISLFGNKRGT
jgi:7-carboxy-7-deazaguanine synthase